MGERGSGVVPVKRHSLEVSRSEKSVWLWKVTPAVANAWNEGLLNTRSLGSITVTVDLLDEGKEETKVDVVEDPTLSPFMVEEEKKLKDGKPPNIERMRRHKATLQLPDCGSETVHENYSVEEGTLPGCLYVFSEISEGRVVVDGLVHKKLLVKQNFQKEQKYFDTTKRKEPRIKETTILYEATTSAPMLFNLSSQKASNIKSHQNKKIRMEKEDLQNKLFELFVKKPRWQINDLIVETLQPRDFLKQTLEEICDKVKEGSKFIYELKPEYKTTPMEDDA